MKLKIFLTSFMLILGSIICAGIASIINSHVFVNFFSNSPNKLFFDIEHYSNLAIHQTCNAFYPLWPWLINKLGQPQTVDDAALYFRLLGSLLSLMSIPLFVWLLEQNIKSYRVVVLIAALYAINPLSVFRMIGYTEGIFSFLSLIFLIFISKIKISLKTSIKSTLVLICVFLLCVLISLTRPFLVQSVFASVFALASILIISRFSKNISYSQIFRTYGATTLAICLGALTGYCIYGYYCMQLRGDFLAPFHDQKAWGKQLGIYPNLFFIPLTYADFISIYLPFIALITSWLIFISNNIKKLNFIVPNFWQWILLFGYPPAFLAFYGLDFKNGNFIDRNSNLKSISLTQSANNVSSSYAFWFCIYFALIHSIIVVFSDRTLASLRRYIFGNPYFFFALAYICQCFPSKKISKLLLLMLATSGVWLVIYWLDYSNNTWIG